jgi:phosphoserine phosphatase RsbU/P
MSKILVIDDDSVIRVIVKKALQNQGHEVLVAANGKEGIEQARRMQPALIICDWMMPFVDGLEVCRWVKANPELTTTFFVLLTSRGGIADRVKGLNTGADDFLSKPIDISELQARVRSGLRLHRLSQDLQTQKLLLEAELAEAAAYVQALLPLPLLGAVSIEARFIPSRQLGGDCFDYFWLDSDHLAIYLLDVSGHGLGAALPSVSVMNLLRSRALPGVDFCQPEIVLKALNDQFQMSSQNEKYFTIWYGVYHLQSCQLTYSSAGHPPAVLITSTPDSEPQITQLRTHCLPIGMMEGSVYVSDRQTVPSNSALYIFSDGVYEFDPKQDQIWDLKTFVEMLKHLDINSSLDTALDKIQKLNKVETFNDDFSLLKVQFNH